MHFAVRAGTMLSLLLCEVAAAPLAAQEPRRIRTAIGEPATLDPAIARSAWEQAVVFQVFSRLVEQETAAGPRPSLASRWTPAPDGLRYTFELAAARFHNGREVAAEDVAGTLRRLLSPARPSPYAGRLAVIEGARAFSAGNTNVLSGVRVLGPRALEVRLQEPYAPFLSLLASAALSIVPVREAEAAGEGFGRAPLGCGPFRLEHWDAQQIVLTAHDGGPEGAPRERGVSFMLVPAGARFADRVQGLLLKRGLDFTFAPQGLAGEAIVVPPGYRRQAHPDLSVSYVGFDTRRGAAADVRVRRGFRAGLDRRALAREMFTDPDLVTDSMIPRGLAGSHLEVPGPDTAAAAALFREVAADTGSPRLRLHYAARRGLEPGLEFLAMHMRELGLELVLAPSASPRDLQVLQERGLVESWLGVAQADSPEPEGLLRSLFHSRGGASARFGYAAPEVDRLLDVARVAAQLDERASAYAQIDATVARDVPSIPLWGGRSQYLVGHHVKGLELSYLPFQIRWARVSLER